MAKFDGSRPGPGRPKGSLNKLGRLARDNVVAVFDQLGGIEAMTEWAHGNPSEFYRIYSRLLPSEANIEIDDGRARSIRQYTDEELMAIIERDEAERTMKSSNLQQ